MRTRKTTIGTRTKLTTSMADLRSVIRFNSNNFNTIHYSFILDETLQLKETPITNPIVHNPTSMLFSNSFEVFHYNLISVKLGNNVFTDVVVNPSHPTSFSSREFSKQSLTGTSAFSLQFTTQIFELPFNLLYFSRIIKPAVRTDSEVVYSEVNAQNIVLRTNVLLSDSNLFRECEQEETSAFFIHPEKALTNFPSEVIFVTSRNVQFELLPNFEKSQNQLVGFDIGTSWEVIPNTCSIYNRLGFSLLDHSTSLLHTSDCYLGREFETLTDSLIDSIMQFEVLSDFMFPSIINTELKSLSVGFDSSNYLFSWIDSNFCSDIRSHIKVEDDGLFKCYASASGRNTQRRYALLPRLKSWVSEQTTFYEEY